MKIEMNIDASNIGETLLDVFKTLNEDQRKEVAVKVLHEWLREPECIHRTGLHRKALAFARERNSWHKEKSDEWFSSTDEYKRFMKDNKTPKEIMIDTITKEVIEWQKKEITKAIKADPLVEQMKNETMAAIKEQFPRIVNDAMIAFFCQNMSEMASGLSRALMMTHQTDQTVKKIAEKVLGQ